MKILRVLFSASLFAAALSGCAGNGHPAAPAPSANVPPIHAAPAAPDDHNIVQLPENRRAQIADIAFAQPNLQNAPQHLPGVSHNPKILAQDPFAHPAPAPARPQGTARARAAKPYDAYPPANPIGYKGLELPLQLMTIAVWFLANLPDNAPSNDALMRLQIYISPESLQQMDAPTPAHSPESPAPDSSPVTVVSESPAPSGKCPAQELPKVDIDQAGLNQGLRLAARAGDADDMCKWLALGADIDDTANGLEESVLHEAVRGQHNNAALILIAEGAKVNQRKEGAGPSPLDIAARNQNEIIAQALRNAGGLCFLENLPLCTDPISPPPPPPTPPPPPPPVSKIPCPAGTLPAEGRTQSQLDRELYLAVLNTRSHNWGEQKRLEICEWLRRGANVNRADPVSQLTPMMLAASGHAGGVAATSGFPWSPPANPGYAWEVMEYLLENDADVNAPGLAGATPLHVAVQHGWDELMEILIEYGANVAAQNNSNNAPLHDAASRGLTAPAEILLKSGADIDARGGQGRTPLHYAAENADANMVEFLLARGADVSLETDNGKTALEIADDAYWSGERNVYVLEVFTHLRERHDNLVRIREILQTAEREAEEQENPPATAAQSDAASAFAQAFNAGPAFGDLFGTAKNINSFSSQLNLLARNQNQNSKLDWTRNPFVGLAGSGFQMESEKDIGVGVLRFSAFGDSRNDSDESSGWTGWLEEGIGAGAQMRALRDFSAWVEGENGSRGALSEFHWGGVDSNFALQLGALEESGAFLSGTSRGTALSDLRARTAFVGAGASAEVGLGWEAWGAMHWGRTWVESGGVLRAGDALSGAFALGAARENWLYSGDQFIARISQPLRVESWEMRLADGGREKGGAPSGRQLDWEAAYHLPLTNRGSLAVSAGARSQAGHSGAAKVQGAGAFSLDWEF